MNPKFLADPIAGTELAAFVAAVEAGSVSGAAEGLQLTQSAVTKRLQALERRVGGRLLERGRFGVRPTELGQVVYPAAKSALDGLGHVAHVIAHSKAESSQDLRLSASHTIGEFLLPSWLTDFQRGQPAVRSQLEIINSRGVLEAVSEGRSEIGFVEGLDETERMEVLTVARDEIVVVVASAHRWSSRRTIAPADLLAEPYMTREAASGTRAVAAAGLATHGLELEPSLQLASFQSLKRALGDRGFTLISRLAIDTEIRAGELSGIPIRGVSLSRELRAIRRRRVALSLPAQAFWRWLSARAEPVV